jgi:hypothetical protein
MTMWQNISIYFSPKSSANTNDGGERMEKSHTLNYLQRSGRRRVCDPVAEARIGGISEGEGIVGWGIGRNEAVPGGSQADFYG